jgi:hypothetical protein
MTVKKLSTQHVDLIQEEFEQQFFDELNKNKIILSESQEIEAASYAANRNFTKAYLSTRPNSKATVKTSNEAASKYFKRNPIILKRAAQIMAAAAKAVILSVPEALANISVLAKSKDETINLRANAYICDFSLKTRELNQHNIDNVKIVYVPLLEKNKKKFQQITQHFLNEKS